MDVTAKLKETFIGSRHSIGGCPRGTLTDYMRPRVVSRNESILGRILCWRQAVRIDMKDLGVRSRLVAPDEEAIVTAVLQLAPRTQTETDEE